VRERKITMLVVSAWTVGAKDFYEIARYSNVININMNITCPGIGF